MLRVGPGVDLQSGGQQGGLPRTLDLVKQTPAGGLQSGGLPGPTTDFGSGKTNSCFLKEI